LSADLRPPNRADAAESADFCLTPEEIERGRQAFVSYLETLRPGEPRLLAAEALDVVAAVISGGICSAESFPWQQVRGYHAALTLSIIREPGSPSRVEALLCRHDDTRKFQQVADRYPRKEIQRMSAALARVVEACRNLGFLDDQEFELARRRTRNEPDTKPVQGRTISEGEVRALIAASVMDTTPPGPRDALMIGLGYSGGLRTVDLVNLNLDDMHFDGKTGRVTVKFRASGAKRARRIPMRNDQLIALARLECESAQHPVKRQGHRSQCDREDQCAHKACQQYRHYPVHCAPSFPSASASTASIRNQPPHEVQAPSSGTTGNSRNCARATG